MHQIYKFRWTPKKLIKNQQEAKLLGEAVNIRPNTSHILQKIQADSNPLLVLYILLCQDTASCTASFILPQGFVFTLTNIYIMPGQAGPIECLMSITDSHNQINFHMYSIHKVNISLIF